jgi:small conductance mechanosensitive channel
VVPKDVSVTLLIQYGVQATSASLILVAGILLARWAGRYADRSFTRINLEAPVRLLLVRTVRGTVMLFTLLVVLQQFGVQIFPLLAGLGIAGVGIGLALQGVFLNLFAGLSIIFTRPFRVGEHVELLGVNGEVQSIDLFSTKLLHADRSTVVIPNRKIIGEILHNYGVTRQLDLSVAVSYSTDLGHALAVVQRLVESNPRVLKEPRPVVGVGPLADSAITIAIKPWVRVSDYGLVQTEIYGAVVEQFRKERIDIPFPQREVRMVGAA